MGFKREDGKFDDPCLEKLEVGETFFVLRAQDRTASLLVRIWILINSWLGSADKLKLDSAKHEADLMDDWPYKKDAD